MTPRMSHTYGYKSYNSSLLVQYVRRLNSLFTDRLRSSSLAARSYHSWTYNTTQVCDNRQVWTPALCLENLEANNLFVEYRNYLISSYHKSTTTNMEKVKETTILGITKGKLAIKRM